MSDQNLILVDKNNKSTGKFAPKKVCHSGNGLTHLAFTLLILNNKNQVLLQDRKHILWDHFWDLTNSHPLHLWKHDENIDEAVERCLQKEWGIKLPVEELFSFRYFAKYKNNFCENEYCLFLLGRYNGEVYPADEVAYGYKWMPINELFSEVKIRSDIYTPWLIRGILELKRRKIVL